MTRLALAVLALAALSGCGLKGGLERPPPMFGREAAPQTHPSQSETAQPPNATDDANHGIGAHTDGAEVRRPTF